VRERRARGRGGVRRGARVEAVRLRVQPLLPCALAGPGLLGVAHDLGPAGGVRVQALRQPKQLLIESRWVSKPLAFAGKLRLNN
jgi:hypothetical protein